MKKSLLQLAFLLVASLFTLGSCVDSDYDLTKVDTDNLVIGTGGFIVPLGDIEIDIAQFIKDYSPAAVSKTPQSCVFKPYSDQFDIESGFDDGLIDKLTEYGEITMNATVSNVGVFDFKLNIKVDFSDGNSEPISIVDDKNISTTSGSVSLTSKTLDRDMLVKIASTKVVRLSIAPSDGATKTFMYDVAQAQKVNIRLSIKKTGGLKL